MNFAAVVNMGGTSTFLSTTFIGNSGARAGVLYAAYSAFVALTTSCFVNNESTFPGSVFLSTQAELSANQDNYGDFNRAVGTTGTDNVCEDVFTETSGSCISDLATCAGTCSVFEASTCPVTRTQFVVPTGSPSLGPSSFPSSNSEPTRLFEEGVEFDNTSLFASNYWLRNIFIGLMILIVAAGLYFYFKSRENKTENKKAASDGLEKTPAAPEGDNDEEAAIQQEKGASGGGGFFSSLRGKGLKKKNKGTPPDPYHPDDDVILDPSTSYRKKRDRKPLFGGFGKKKKNKDDQTAGATTNGPGGEDAVSIEQQSLT